MYLICNKCGVELIENNWYNCDRQRKIPLKQCKSCRNKLQQQWQHRHPEYHTNKKYQIAWWSSLVLEVLIHYSGTNPPQCANPFGIHKESFTDLRCLSIDHMNGGGANHLKEIGGHLTWWLRKNNYPEGYQVLCMNCQWIKRKHVTKVVIYNK